MPSPDHIDIMEFKPRGDRKASKPLMEKRRRARINHCLSQLKSLVVDKTHTESSRQTKLEKADILELTVRHLYEIKRHQRTASLLNESQTRKKFELGFTECVKEVDAFFSTRVQLDDSLKRRLKDHLFHKIKDMEGMSATQEDLQEPSAVASQKTKYSVSATSEDNHNAEEVSLVPKRLPNGDLAVVIPPHLLSRSSSCVSCPLSAFRLICSPWPSSNYGHETIKTSTSSSSSTSLSSISPLSSSVSDVSEEESSHQDLGHVEGQDLISHLVWRPW